MCITHTVWFDESKFLEDVMFIHRIYVNACRKVVLYLDDRPENNWDKAYKSCSALNHTSFKPQRNELWSIVHPNFWNQTLMVPHFIAPIRERKEALVCFRYLNTKNGHLHNFFLICELARLQYRKFKYTLEAINFDPKRSFSLFSLLLKRAHVIPNILKQKF